MPGSLRAAFLAALPEAAQEAAGQADLEARLAALWGAAQLGCPGLAVPGEAFAAHLAARVADRPDPLEALDGLHAADLYLALGCARGEPQAVARFLHDIVPHVESAVLAVGATASDVDEIRALLIDALLIASADRTPAIARYAGRGQLRSWVRSIAVRMAMRHLGRTRAVAGNDLALANLPDAHDDPELEHLKRSHGEAFRDCLRAALADLTVRQRNVLRQHYLDELTVDQLGALYRVHRATAARWVAAARETLFDDTRRRLIERLGLAPADYPSLLRLLHSEIDVSIQRHLGQK